jgi:predicted transposase YdaD
MNPLILDLIETMLVYKLPALSREEIQTMIGLTNQDLKKSRFYQEVRGEGDVIQFSSQDNGKIGTQV